MKNEKLLNVKEIEEEEKEKPYLKIIIGLEGLLVLKDTYEKLTDEMIREGEKSKESYENKEKLLKGLKEQMLKETKELAVFLNEERNETYTYDEILERLKKIEKEEEERKTVKSN